MQQLSITDVTLRSIAADLPKIETPVFRWRKLVRRLDPIGSRPGRAAFQAVASALADYADREGRRCRPSIPTLVADTGFGERTVQYSISELERWGVVRCDRRGGRGRASEYTLLCPGPKGAWPAVDQPVDDAGETAGSPAERVHVETVKGAPPCTPGPSEGLPEEEAIAAAAAVPVDDAPWLELALRASGLPEDVFLRAYAESA